MQIDKDFSKQLDKEFAKQLQKVFGSTVEYQEELNIVRFKGNKNPKPTERYKYIGIKNDSFLFEIKSDRKLYRMLKFSEKLEHFFVVGKYYSIEPKGGISKEEILNYKIKANK